MSQDALLSPKQKLPSAYTILKGPPTTDEAECHLLQFDGLCIPNPGVATAGAVLYGPDSKIPIAEQGEFIGRGTNNVAEYNGLLIGVKMAIKQGVKKLLIEGDSALVIQQTGGNWKVNNVALWQLNKEIRDLLLTQFEFVALRHVYRASNVAADAITNEVFKQRQSFYRVL